jgi:hypothetical protein
MAFASALGWPSKGTRGRVSALPTTRRPASSAARGARAAPDVACARDARIRAARAMLSRARRRRSRHVARGEPTTSSARPRWPRPCYSRPRRDDKFDPLVMAAPVTLSLTTSGTGRRDVPRARFSERHEGTVIVCEMQRRADARIRIVYSSSGMRAILATSRPRSPTRRDCDHALVPSDGTTQRRLRRRRMYHAYTRAARRGGVPAAAVRTAFFARRAAQALRTPTRAARSQLSQLTPGELRVASLSTRAPSPPPSDQDRRPRSWTAAHSHSDSASPRRQRERFRGHGEPCHSGLSVHARPARSDFLIICLFMYHE